MDFSPVFCQGLPKGIFCCLFTPPSLVICTFDEAKQGVVLLEMTSLSSNFLPSLDLPSQTHLSLAGTDLSTPSGAVSAYPGQGNKSFLTPRKSSQPETPL